MQKWRWLSLILQARDRFPRIWELVLAPSVLLIIYWIFLGESLKGHSRSNTIDSIFLIHPLFSFVSDSFSSGDFPYWIHSIMGGLPLYTTPQFSVLYPFYFFGFHLYHTPLDGLIHVHYLTLFHLGILYLNTYIMLRIFHLPMIPAIVGATFFAFCRNMDFYLMWISLTAPYSWFPLALGSIFLILENKYPVAGLFLGILSFSALTLASPSQSLIHVVFTSLFLIVSYFILRFNKIGNKKVIVRNLILLGAACAALTAAAVIPAYLSIKESIRWIGASEPLIGDAKIPFADYLVGQSPPSELANIFFPLRKVSSIVGNSYMGILPIFFVAFSLFKAGTNWVVLPLFLFGLYTLLSSTGMHLGFAFINYHLPFWNKIREPERHLFLYTLMFSALSSFGFQYLWEWSKNALPVGKKHVLAFTLFLLALTVSYITQQKSETFLPYDLLFRYWLLFLFVLILLRFLFKSREILAKILLAIIGIYCTLAYPFNIPLIKDGDYFFETNLRSHRILKEISRIPDIRNYRLAVEDNELEPQFWAMNGIYYGIRSFECYMNPVPYVQWTDVFFAWNNKNYSRLLGAKYFLCRDCKGLPAEYRISRQLESYRLYETDSSCPRYFAVNQILGTFSSKDDFYEKVQENNDLCKAVYLNATDYGKASKWVSSKTDPLRINVLREISSLNTLHLSLKTNSRGLLVLNEYFNKDWKVRLNGAPGEPLKVNLNQIGILIPEGTSDVQFEFKPSLFIILLRLQQVSFFVLILSLFVIAYRNKANIGHWFKEETKL